jgi:catechol 2,3-dioxygenase-like lactoylglutathione lyase family enzyme
VPHINGILESCLYVEDLARSEGFYRDVLGLARIDGSGRFAAFQAGEGQVLLLFRRGSTSAPAPTPGGIIPPHGAQGRQHVAFAIGRDDLDAWRERLREKNVAIESEVRWPRGGTSLYIRDPDGHSVELAAPGVWPVY